MKKKIINISTFKFLSLTTTKGKSHALIPTLINPFESPTEAIYRSQ